MAAETRSGQAPIFRSLAAFILMELAVPMEYIVVTSHVLANVANALPDAGRRRYPPRRFVSSPSTAPTAPPRISRPSFPGLPQVSPRPRPNPID